MAHLEPQHLADLRPSGNQVDFAGTKKMDESFSESSIGPRTLPLIEVVGPFISRPIYGMIHQCTLWVAG